MSEQRGTLPVVTRGDTVVTSGYRPVDVLVELGEPPAVVCQGRVVEHRIRPEVRRGGDMVTLDQPEGRHLLARAAQ